MRERFPARRLSSLLLALAVIGAPALIARAFCLGKSCDSGASAEAAVPFCPLPSALRALVAAGFRSERSPDVMGATGPTPALTSSSGVDVPWPSEAGLRDTQVPIVFLGPGIDHRRLPPGTGLDRIAPTLAAIAGFDPPHPEVRSGDAVPGIGGGGAGVPLLVEIVWKGVGTQDLGGSWPPHLATLANEGAATLDGTTGSLPVDPTASLTTIGTGGLPFEHGITGTQIRNRRGRVVDAWSPDAPTSIITTLADELDRADSETSKVVLVGTAPEDRGLIGDGWYLDADRDTVHIDGGSPVTSVERSLSAGMGTDATTDVLAVVLDGPVMRMDHDTDAIVRAVRTHVPDAAMVVTTTGSTGDVRAGIQAESIAHDVDLAAGARVVAASAPGGLFLDGGSLARAGLSPDVAVQAMNGLTTRDGRPLFADAYPSFSVAFSRYC